MIHAGSGIIHCHAYDALRRVAELLHAPVTTSWAARGMLAEDSPLAITMPHVKLNHKVRNDADVVLILGSRIGETDWWGKPPYWRLPPSRRPYRSTSTPTSSASTSRPTSASWPMPSASSNCSGDGTRVAQGRDQARCPPHPRRRLRQDHAGRPRRLGQGALRHGGADASGPHRRRLPRTLPRGLGAGRRRRQRDDLGHVLPQGHGAQHGDLDLQVRHARRRHLAGRGRRAGAAGQAGLLHHRRRRHGLPFAGSRNRGAQQGAGDLHRARRQAVGHGQDEPAVHAAADQDHDLQAPRSRRDDQGRPRRDQVRQAGREHGRLRRAGFRSGRTQAGAAARAGHGRLRGDPRRCRSGQAHVGAGADTLQEDARGTQGP
jgi:hypothetical protein